MVMKPQTMKYLLKDAPTYEQRCQIDKWNKAHGDSFGVTLRYEMREEIRSTWYGPRHEEVWYMIIEHDPTRSGAQPPRIGRPPKELPPAKVIRQRHSEGRSMAALAHEYGVTRPTLYRHLASDKS